MSLRYTIRYGENVNEDYLNGIDPIDKDCYEPEYQGDGMTNTIERYRKEKRSFVFVEERFTGRPVGYINFFPCGDDLYKDIAGLPRKKGEDENYVCDHIRDDDIAADEIECFREEDVCREEEASNHIFVLSIAILGSHRNGEAIKVLSDGFISYLKKLNEKYPISDITATAVSGDGRRALSRFLFRKLRELDDGNTVYICDGIRLEKFLENDLYIKTYSDDIYLMLPLAEHSENLRVSRLFKEPPPEDDGIADTIIEEVRNYIEYECSNEVAKALKAIKLGTFEFLHTTDDYTPCVNVNGEEQEVVLDDVKGYAVLFAHPHTHMFILTVYFPDYPQSSTQMLDQVSYGYLKIKDPEGSGKYVPISEYLLKKYGLHPCGETKALIYLDKLPPEKEMQDLLAAEAVNNFEKDYQICSRELKDIAADDKSQYENYEVYLSRRCIVYRHVDEEGSEITETVDKIKDIADYLFIVILTLFQNTALAKVNTKVTNLLENDGDVSIQAKLDIDREYGQTVRFWEMQNFKYLPAQQEAEHIRTSFRNSELKESYKEHQEYLEHVVEVKNAITEQRNGLIIDVVAIVLALIQIQPFMVEMAHKLYAFMGIEVRGVSDGAITNPETTFNYVLVGGVILFILLLRILRRRNRVTSHRQLR